MPKTEGGFEVVGGKPGEKGTTYSHYFETGCHPSTPDVVVTQVEEKLVSYLDGNGLGLPLKPNLTVKDTIALITEKQGALLNGVLEASLGKICAQIVAAIRTPDTQAANAVVTPRAAAAVGQR